MVKSMEDVDTSIYEQFGSGPIEFLKCKVCQSCIVSSYHKKHIDSEKHQKAIQNADPINDIKQKIDAYETEYAKMTLEIIKLTEKLMLFKRQHREEFQIQYKQLNQYENAKTYLLGLRLQGILNQ